MDDTTFLYRIPGRSGGQRPGAHAARTSGTGNEFNSHARLFDLPDPRRLDLRASLRSVRDEWLVRTYRQRAAIPLQAVVDVSASMGIGSPRTKLDIAADFAGAMAGSAFKLGDAAGLLAFDGSVRDDLFMPALHRRGAAQIMRASIAAAKPTTGQGCGLAQAARQLAGRQALVFIVSDFHWPLDEMAAAMDMLDSAWVVPLVVWDNSEVAPPETDGFIRLRDAEGGGAKPVWLNDALRRRWKNNIAARRNELDKLFGSRNLRPIYLSGAFSPDVLSQYFLELAA